MNNIINNKKLKYTIIFSSIILIIIIILLLLILLNRKPKLKDNTIITIDDEVVESYKVEISNFFPGYEKEYKITFISDDINKYDVSIDFNNPNEGKLKEYLNIVIITKHTYLENTMNNFLTEEEIYLGKGIEEIIIKYKMPEEIGNEAQGTSVKFNLDISITNKEREK